MSQARSLAFAAVCVVCAAGIVVALGPLRPLGDRSTAATTTSTGSATHGGTSVPVRPVEDVVTGPHVAYSSTAIEDFRRVRVTSLPLADQVTPDVAPTLGLECERLSVGGGRGICLRANRGVVTSYERIVFDAAGHEVDRRPLVGLPSRTRVAPDGRHGATTTVVAGHDYASTGFSTLTEIVDLATGATVADLEELTATKEGVPFMPVDRNFWGVTFAADGTHFYATMGTGGHTFLVEGDLTSRSVEVLEDGVECPALSPDGTRVAFKQRADGELGRIGWRLAVLDLATGAVTSLPGTAGVDDQADWLDDATVLYSTARAESGTPTKDTWAVAADGTAAPAVFLAGAYSLVVHR